MLANKSVKGNWRGLKATFEPLTHLNVCAKVYEKDHPERVSHYKNINDELKWDNVNFPSSDVDIDTFEEDNGGKAAVNVYFIDPEEGVWVADVICTACFILILTRSLFGCTSTSCEMYSTLRCSVHVASVSEAKDCLIGILPLL